MKLSFKSITLPIFLSLLTVEVYSQIGFDRSDSITVLKINGDTLKNPWAGGFNSVQFSEIDLDLDGIRDLLVFDKDGNRISTFINDGIPNQPSYTYDPSYISQLQFGFQNWVLTRDYNCDGKMDIMAYHSGGIKAFKNTSTTQLSFELDTIAIKSDYDPDGTGSVIPLFVSPTDIPALDDIDGDGDLDVLTFGIQSTQVEYHKNLSMETTGTCNELIFELSNKCWGFFFESVSSNSVVLFDTCQWNINNPQKYAGGNKHAGSNLLTLDVDGNKSKDLVLGDVSFNNFTLLINGDSSPNKDHSSMIAQDPQFPQNNNATLATEIEVFPAGFYLDVNNDSVKDLIAAPSCNSGCANNNNVWYYNNSNATDHPNFNFITDAFLQEGMIEVGEDAHPVFFDYNEDGLIDMVVGNYGVFDSSLGQQYKASLWLYKNIGSLANPVYQLINKDFAGISSINLDVVGSRPTLGLHPTFEDLDGDNDKDMILGDYNGKLHFFTNTAGAGNTAVFTLTESDFFGIDVGNDATPLLYDLDKDSLLDLVIGNRLGTFVYYKNIGTDSVPNFNLITDSLGGAITKRYTNFDGNSCPFIVDSVGTTMLFSGSAGGYIYKYGNIDNNLTGTFTVDSAFHNIWEGINSTISIADINDDSKLDMLVGNHAGGVAFYKGSTTIFIPSVEEKDAVAEFHIYPNPTNGLINIDLGKNDLKDATLTVSNLLGKVILNKQVVTQKTTLNINGFSSGFYMVRFTNQKGSKTYKIIKE